MTSSSADGRRSSPVAGVGGSRGFETAAGTVSRSAGARHPPPPVCDARRCRGRDDDAQVGLAVAVPSPPHPRRRRNDDGQGVSKGRACFSVGRGDGAVKVLAAEADAGRGVRVHPPGSGLPAPGGTWIDGKVVDGAADGDRPVIDVEPPIDIAATRPPDDRAGRAHRGLDQFLHRRGRRAARRSIDLARDAAEADRDFEELGIGCYVQMAVVGEDDEGGLESGSRIHADHLLGLRRRDRRPRT